MVDTNTSGNGLLQKVFGFFRSFSGNTTPGGHLLYEGYVSGYQYHKGQQYEHQFGPGTDFLLRHEPENPFDDDAVAVYYNNHRIGFIPKGWNEEVARMIKRGKHVQARVARFDPTREPWERLQVEVVYEPEREQDLEKQA